MASEDKRDAAEPEFQSRIDRRELLKRGGGAGLGILGLAGFLAACSRDGDSADAPAPTDPAPEETPSEPPPEEPPAETPAEVPAPPAALGTVRWISPRGTLDAMDDYSLHVPLEMGYFDDLAVAVELNAGTGENEMHLVATGQVDMGYPSPGVLTTAINQDVPVIMVWQMYAGQVFNFTVHEDSDVQDATELDGATIAVWTADWKPIIDPMLLEAGADPESITLVEGGAEWNQLVADRQADAALGWRGLSPQLIGQGLPLRFILGEEFSAGPSNGYAIRSGDLEDPALVDLYTRFLAGSVMGLEFAKANPQAAAQITYNRLPSLAETMTPRVALESMLDLAVGIGQTERDGQGWGHFRADVWDSYLSVIFEELGQTGRLLAADEVWTDRLVEPANSGADTERAIEDAMTFELDEDFADTTIPSDLDIRD